MKINQLKNYKRHDIIKLLPDSNQLIGVELGVAKGTYSKRMVESGKFLHFIGVDMYADHHNVAEYKEALKTVGMYSNYKLLRMTFDEALELFPDYSLDFVYVDGYAHTGEEGGDTIYKWYNKVKIGGLLAGDDYHEKWPLVIKSVNTFADSAKLDVYLTDIIEDKDFCKYPSWAVIKSNNIKLIAPTEMVREGKNIGSKIKEKREGTSKHVETSNSVNKKTKNKSPYKRSLKKIKTIFKSLNHAKQKENYLEKVKTNLLLQKTWRYLRYIHSREAIKILGEGNVLVIGAGLGLAEVALALEFPKVHFHLTDWKNASHSLNHAKKYINEFNLNNITFGELNILDPAKATKYDLVYSVEVLEHIKDDNRAAVNMHELSKQNVFCLVPFADDATNADPIRRKRVLEKCEHYVAGYDSKRLIELFPNPIALRGCYWSDAGLVFREQLNDLNESDILSTKNNLFEIANKDLRPIIPTHSEAQGIWILSKI